jgi:hypothetical protein
MAIVQDLVSYRRSPQRVQVICQTVCEFLIKFPQFNHLSFLSSKFATNWSAKTLEGALIKHGLPTGITLEVPQRGRSYQAAEEMCLFMSNPEVTIDDKIEFLEALSNLRQVSDMSYQLEIQEDETEEDETEGEDVI